METSLIPNIRNRYFLMLDAIALSAIPTLALAIRLDGFAGVARYLQGLIVFTALGLAVRFAIFWKGGLYRRYWAYASVQEMGLIAAVVTLAAAANGLLFFQAWRFLVLNMPAIGTAWTLLPRSVPIIDGLLSLIAVGGSRLSVRFIEQWRLTRRRARQGAERTRVLIVGAGEAGQLLARSFLGRREGLAYEVVGFVDDAPAKKGISIHTLPVLGDRRAISTIVTRHRVDLIVIAMFNVSPEDFRAILDICEQTDAVIRVLPNIFDTMQAIEGMPPIRDVTAEDLLGRETIEIDHAACGDLLADKVVLVTGAAGTIGSELCRQVLGFGPQRLLMLDNNETGLFDLMEELDPLGNAARATLAEPRPEQELVPIIGDVTNQAKMRAMFETFRPAVVFHTAAYKHVPLMEAHPDEAVRVNVMGTRITGEMASAYGTERFVLISTDKAVNPSSVMGASKQLCETMVEMAGAMGEFAGSHAGKSSVEDSEGGKAGNRTLFTAVRFGNVLGSRGSVVPTFERQIDRGGPVTVTDTEMTRYFMSISEAVRLVIQAATLTQGGDIFILDMGRSIRIDDLARRLIRLRGLRPDVDVSIIYTGPRPGEKMHEELLGQDERVEATSHAKIALVRSEQSGARGVFQEQLDDLVSLAMGQQTEAMLARLRELTQWNGTEGKTGEA